MSVTWRIASDLSRTSTKDPDPKSKKMVDPNLNPTIHLDPISKSAVDFDIYPNMDPEVKPDSKLKSNLEQTRLDPN